MSTMRATVLGIVGLMASAVLLNGGATATAAWSDRSWSASVAPANDPEARPRLERRVIRIVNKKRVAHGCRQVGARTTLRTAARRHSVRMALANSMVHQLPGEPSIGDRITNAGYQWSAYGENILYGASTARAAMRWWMDSPDHKKNILNCRFRHLGVGAISYNGVIWWTQDFGRPD